MKKFAALIIILIITPLVLVAQNQAVQDFQNKYKSDRDVTYVEITGSLFKFIGSIAEGIDTDESGETDPDMEALARVARGITSLKVLSVPKYETGLKQEEITNLRSSLEKDNYEILMTFKEGSKYIHFMAQGNEGELRNMLVLVDKKDEFTILNIDGKLTVEDLSYLARRHHNWH